MARVYISSSYKDLIETRAAAREAVLALNHLPVGMETYSASPDRPIEYCLADVRSCQIYIGIFAWRYGEIAKEFGKSFTQLEYEQAVNSELQIFIFLLHEDAPWPLSKSDLGRDKIAKLRKQLSEAHLPAFFRTNDELKYKILHSLKHPSAHPGGASGEARQIPDLLPFLADVSTQEFELHKALTERKAAPRRPVVCIVQGDELQSHEMMWRRFVEYTLRQLLSMQPTDPAVTPYTLTWPSGSRSPKELHQRLQFELARKVKGGPAEISEILNHLAHIPGPVACRCSLLTENFLDAAIDPLDEFLRFWEEFPELERDQLFIVFLFVKFQSRRGLLRVFSRESRRLAQKNEEILKSLEQLTFDKYSKVTGSCLRLLEGVRQSDAEDWAVQHASKFTNGAELVPLIRELFQRWQQAGSGETMPMETAAAAFRSLLFSFNHQQEGLR